MKILKWAALVIGGFFVLMVIVGLLIPSEDPTTTKASTPGPTTTVTKTVSPPVITKTATVTKKVTKKVVPRSCLEAISLAENIGQEAGKSFGIAAKYPPLIAEAYKSGFLQDDSAAQAVISKMKSYTGELNDAADTVTPLVQRFNVAKTQCRSES